MPEIPKWRVPDNPKSRVPDRALFIGGQELLPDDTKLCTRCRERLPLGRFTPKPGRPSGYDSWCRACRADYNRTWRAARKG